MLKSSKMPLEFIWLAVALRPPVGEAPFVACRHRSEKKLIAKTPECTSRRVIYTSIEHGMP